MKTPPVPFSEQVVSYVVVVTGKDKMISNALPFTFLPAALCVADGMFYQKPSKSPMECVAPYSRLSPCYSPQPSTPSSTGCFTAEDDGHLPFFPSTPPASAFEGILDMCAQQLDKNAEEEILQTAVLPADSTSLTMQELDEKELPMVILAPDAELDKNEENILPPTILLPAQSVVHQPAVTMDMNLRN